MDEDDLDRVREGANALTGRRRAWQAGVVAGVLAVASAGLYLANDAGSSADTPAPSAEPSAGGSPPVESTPTAETPPTAEERLLSQLEERADVRQHLLGVTSVDGLVLCGLNDLGHNEDEDELYVWLYCGSFTTGPQAENISAGNDAAVVSAKVGADGATEVVDVAFPPMGDQAEDIRTMFPPPVAERVISGNLTFEPTEGDLLRIAQAATD